MQDSSTVRYLNNEAGTTLSATRGPDGWSLYVAREQEARATIEPPHLQLPDGTLVGGRWETLTSVEGGLLAQGTVAHAAGRVQCDLRLVFDSSPEQPLALDWQIDFVDGPFTGALVYGWTLHGVERDPGRLDLPSLHYGCATYGTGMFPHPDPRSGFAFRADRMAQAALHYSAATATWSIFAPSETPEPVVAEQMYAIGATPTEQETGLRVFFRYPQQEFGHRGDGSDEAYIGKETFAPGEQVYREFDAGSTLRSTFFVLCRPPAAAHDHATAMRFLWRRYAGPRAARPEQTLLSQAGRHIRWFNRRLYNPSVGGGQYESPEGSGTAMLGFVEQSLLMASTTLRYAALCAAAAPLPPDELRHYCEQAAGALTRWATEGRTPEGLLYPACDRSGYHFGYRNYGDYENLTIVRDESLDTIRLASEARSLLAAAWSAQLAQPRASEEPQIWAEAALSVARWIVEHRLPKGGYAGRYHRTGQPLDPYPSGTSAVIGLFAECARWLDERDPATSQRYRELAVQAYDDALGALIAAGVFGGGTLDASCPDREAAIAALDACITLYELTDDPRFLEAGRGAADNILSYTFVYPITTFGADSDASRRRISTFGASTVSPENQHLDPVSTAPCLLLYGLYTGDDVAVHAAVETLHWTLDGRWAFDEPDGLKQSEQLLHTRWYYNTFFSRRGDVRVGMPLWGRSDSEHGWPQVVPTAAFLGTGQVVLDWRTGRAVGVDGWQVSQSQQPSEREVVLKLAPTDSAADQGHAAMCLKVLRLPQSRLQLDLNGERSIVQSSQLEHGYLLDVPLSHNSTLRLSQQ
ncbi:MAG TPA: hypothetical protein VFZ66_23580 [Herpetosiphonaceae bacterium]